LGSGSPALPAATPLAPAESEFSRAATWTLGVSCVTLALAYGVYYAYAVFLVALLREFHWSRSILAGAFSVFSLVNGATNPMLGWIGDRIGPRRLVVAGGFLLAVSLGADSLIESRWHLFAAFGVLTAAGVAMSGWTPAVMLVQGQFRQQLGLALGIAGSGIGLGIFLVVPLCQALIDTVGWRWAFRVLGVICAVWIVPATWLVLPAAGPAPGVRRAAPPEGGGPEAGAELTLLAALATAPFWLITAAKFLGNIASQTLHVHQAAFLVDHGVTAMVAASVISVVGAASIVGKTGGGWLSDHLARETVYALGMACIIASLGLLWLVAAAPRPWLTYGYATLFGLGYAVTASLVPAMVSDRFRGPHFGAIFGVTQVGSALGTALGPWLAGWSFDVTGSYAMPFSLAAATAAAAALSVTLSRRFPCPDRPRFGILTPVSGEEGAAVREGPEPPGGAEHG
jgi:MFS family permease